jgi:hypothetical protein
MAAKFQNLTLDYRTILKMSMTDRVSMLKDQTGRGIMAGFTPEELSRMFPRYYADRLPDVGSLLKSLANPESAAPGSAGAASSETAKSLQKPSWVKKLETDTATTISDPGAKAQLKREQKEVFDLLKQGKIDADDPRLKFLNDMTPEDLKKSGIEKLDEGEGKQSFKMTPTKSAEVSDESIAEQLRKESTSAFSPREQATLDFISKREGSSNPDIIFGDRGNVPGSGKYSKMLGLDKRPLSDMSITEVLEMQKKMTRLTAADGVGGGRGTSAVGTGQMIRGTLEGNLRALGIPEDQWKDIKFDKTLQQRLTLQNFKSGGIGDPNADPSTWNHSRLGSQYESLDTRKGFSAMSDAERRRIAEAAPTRPPSGREITTADIENKRQQMIQAEYASREATLAERTIGDLPRGADPQVVAYYNKLTPKQKQDFLQIIEKSSGAGAASASPEQLQVGMQKVNEAYKADPKSVTASLDRSTRPSPEQRASAEQKDNAKHAIIAMGTNDFQNSRDTYANTLKAIQNAKAKGMIPVIIPPNPNDRRFAGVSAEVRRAAVDAGAQIDDAKYDSKDPLHLSTAEAKRIAAQYQGGIPVGDSNAVRIGIHMGMKNDGKTLTDPDGNVVAKTGVGTGTITGYNAPPPPDKTASIVEPGEQVVAVQETGEEDVQSLALGGEVKTDAKGLSAYSFDKDRLQRDNLLVTDGNKPVFTMNDKERMNFDPQSGKVRVDPNKIGPEKQEKAEPAPQPQQQEAPQNSATMSQAPSSPSMGTGNFPMSTPMSESTFKSPSFERAVSRSKFNEHAGEHFDEGASNLR